MKTVVAFHEYDICTDQCSYDDTHIEIVIDRQQNKSERNDDLRCRIEARYRYVRYLQFIGHNLIGVFAMSLSEILAKQHPVAYSHGCIDSVYCKEDEIRYVARLNHQSAQSE